MQDMQDVLRIMRNATPEEIEEFRQLINYPRIDVLDTGTVGARLPAYHQPICVGPPVFHRSYSPSVSGGLYDNDDSE